MATQFAQVCKGKGGFLEIRLRFADGRRDKTTFGIGPSDELFSIPYTTWAEHIGTTVDLSRWVGTGEGMIGGPTRTRIAACLYDGPLGYLFPPDDPEVIRKGIQSLKGWLADERYEFSPEVHEQLNAYIVTGYTWLAEND